MSGSKLLPRSKDERFKIFCTIYNKDDKLLIQNIMIILLEPNLIPNN